MSGGETVDQIFTLRMIVKILLAKEKKEEEERQVLVGKEQVDRVCYLGDVMRGKGGEEAAISTRIASAGGVGGSWQACW